MIPDRSVDAAAIAAASAALDQSLVSGTPADVAGCFTEDAVLGESGWPDVIGRPAIERFLTEANAVRTVVGHRIHQDELVFVGPDRALEFGRFDETKIKPGHPDPIHERGRTVTDWRRGPDGRWRIARVVVSDLPSP